MCPEMSVFMPTEQSFEGRLEGTNKVGPAVAETTVIPGLTPTKEGLMIQSTFTTRQTAIGGA